MLNLSIQVDHYDDRRMDAILRIKYLVIMLYSTFLQDWSLFGKIDLSGSAKATEAGIPVLTDKKGAYDIHNQILAWTFLW